MRELALYKNCIIIIINLPDPARTRLWQRQRCVGPCLTSPPPRPSPCLDRRQETSHNTATGGGRWRVLVNKTVIQVKR